MINIRKATQDDLSSILHLASQLSDATHIDERQFLKNLPMMLNDEQHCLLIATNDQKVIGYLSSYFHRTIYANGQVAYIDEIVIEDSHRGQKIGTDLMAKFELIAADYQCRLISLATAGAKGFYEKLGYSSKAQYYKKYLH